MSQWQIESVCRQFHVSHSRHLVMTKVSRRTPGGLENSGGFGGIPPNESPYNQTYTLSAANSGHCQLWQHGSDRLN